MNIEIVTLTPQNLKDAPEWDNPPYSCKYCIYWEFPEECADLAKAEKDIVLKKKVTWLQNAHKYGTCGKLLYVDGAPVGYAQYAPPGLLPRAVEYPSGPPSEDAVLISCLFIPHKEYRYKGLGTILLHTIIDDLKERRVRAVETFARKGNPNNPSGPVKLYVKNGFRIQKDDREFPLLRLDL